MLASPNFRLVLSLTLTFLCGFLLLDRINLPAPQNNVGRITINRILGMQSTLNGGGGVYTAQ
jgi:hypothetical protein